jgi:hypothetical protein
MTNTAFTVTGGGNGTVNSVGVTSSTLTVTNSPITSSGNINIELPVAAGGLRFIESKSAAAVANLDFIGLSSTYLNYLFIATDLKVSTAGANFNALYSVNNGVSYDSGANYAYAYTKVQMDGPAPTSTVGSAATNAMPILINLTDDANTNHTFSYEIYEPSASILVENTLRAQEVTAAPLNRFTVNGGGVYTVISAINAVRFFVDVGTFNGNITLYGYTKS